MKRVRAVLLMNKASADIAVAFAKDAGIEMQAAVVDEPGDLARACDSPTDLILSFGSGLIVPASILADPNLLALNIHPASPDFPGRDPHHFAHYFRAKAYGATLHFMADKVDAGPIIATEMFDVPDRATPAMLLLRANDAGFELMRRFFNSFASHGWPQANPSLKWASRKSTRKDFLQLCRVHPDMEKGEFLRRLNATSMPEYSNLYIDLHGYRFRLEGKTT